MKENVVRRKVVRINPGMMGAGCAVSNDGRGVSVEECVNLVRDASEGLCPAPGIRMVTDGDHEPLAVYHDSTGCSHTLLVENGMLHIRREPDDSMTEVGRAGEPVFCAVARRGGFTLMCGGGAVEIDLRENGSWKMGATAREWPEMWLEAESRGTLTASTGPMVLKGVEFSRTEPKIGAAAQKLLDEELCGAYQRVASAASTAGVWIAPVVARYHLLGPEGERLWSSSPTVMSAGGWQCEGILSAEGSKEGADGLSVPSLKLEAECFKVVMKLAPGAAECLNRAGVAAVEITVTPQQHPCDSSLSAPWRIVHPTLANPVLQTALPGATENFGLRHEYFSRRMMDTLSRLGDLEERLTVMYGPFQDGTAELDRIAGSDADEESRRLCEAWSRQPEYHPGAYGSTLMDEITGAGGFVARCVAANGDMVAWGDITPLAGGSRRVAELCSGFVDEPYRGVLSVTRRDSTRINLAIGGERRPTAWSACVGYPDSRVAGLDIYVEDTAGGTWHGHADLQPTADGSHAVALDQELEGKAFRLYADNMPAVDRTPVAGERRPGAIAAARISAPLTVVSALECSHSPILAIEPALRSQSSWDFSRCHLYAFSASGIHAVAINGAKKLIAATTIDRRGVADASGVTATPEGVMALHPTAEGAQLMRIAASRATTEQDMADGVALAWDTAHSRLLMLDRRGRLRLHDIGRGEWSLVEAEVEITAIHSPGNDVWLRAGEALRRLETLEESRRAERRTTVRWRGKFAVEEHSRVAGIELEWSASAFDGSVSVGCGRDASGRMARRMLEMRIKGALKGWLLRPVAGWATPMVEVEISGRVAGDFRLRRISIYFRKG